MSKLKENLRRCFAANGVMASRKAHEVVFVLYLHSPALWGSMWRWPVTSFQAVTETKRGDLLVFSLPVVQGLSSVKSVSNKIIKVGKVL